MRTGAKIGMALAGTALAGAAALGLGRYVDERRVANLWRTLRDAARDVPETALDDLPEPARRYLAHALQPGASRHAGVELAMSGSIKTGQWLPIRATQIIVPAIGFVWKARVGSGPLTLRGADYYYHNDAALKFRLRGVLPVLSASSPEIARSARGRLALESMMCPAGLLPGPHVTWRTHGEDSATADITIDGVTIPLTITIGPAGELREAITIRYNADPNLGPVGDTPFGMTGGKERTFDGVTIPTSIAASWHYGTPYHRETFRFAIEDARFGIATN